MILLRRLYRNEVPSLPLLLLEGILVAAVGVGAASWLFPEEASLVCVFYASVATSDTMDRSLGWNRRAIFTGGTQPLVANLTLGTMLMMLFLGSTLGYAAFALTLPLETVDTLFSRQLEHMVHRDFQSMTFGSFGSVLGTNLSVMAFFFLAALLFHHGGVMLALGWSASVWAATFSTLARIWSDSGGPGLPESFLRVMGACLPHMLLEAAAYVLAGLAGVFIAKGLARHSLASQALASVALSCVALLGMAAVLVLAGAAFETQLTPMVVAWASELI